MKKLLSIVLSAALIWTSGSLAQAVAAAPDIFIGPSTLPQFQLTPPGNLGRIVDYFNGGQTHGSVPTSPLIILIQDLHAHYGVQKNIAGILDFIAEKLPHSSTSQPPYALAVEGAAGPIDSSVMALFPDEKIKLAASDYLMREGELTGAEYFAVKRGLPHFLVGAENEQYYLAHRELFRKTLSDREELVRSLKAIQNDIHDLPRYVYHKNKALWEFQKKVDAFDKGEMSTHDFIGLLMGHVGAIDIKRDFPTLASFAANSRFGSMDQIRGATADFLTQTQGRLSAQEKKDLQVLAKNKGTTTYYLYLRDLIYQHQLFLAVAPELAQYLEYIHTAQTMGMDRVVHEARELAFRIKLDLARGDQPAVDLVQVQHDLDLLLRLADLQATEYEVRDFAPRLNQFVAFTKALVNTHTQFDEQNIRRLISSSIDFYVMALVRNKPMIENTLRLMDRSATQPADHQPPRTAVLVAGGFHTTQLTTMLREKNISYLVITPTVDKISEADHTLYVKRLNGDLLTPEAILGKLDDNAPKLAKKDFDPLATPAALNAGVMGSKLVFGFLTAVLVIKAATVLGHDPQALQHAYDSIRSMLGYMPSTAESLSWLKLIPDLIATHQKTIALTLTTASAGLMGFFYSGYNQVRGAKKREPQTSGTDRRRAKQKIEINPKNSSTERAHPENGGLAEGSLSEFVKRAAPLLFLALGVAAALHDLTTGQAAMSAAVMLGSGTYATRHRSHIPVLDKQAYVLEVLDQLRVDEEKSSGTEPLLEEAKKVLLDIPELPLHIRERIRNTTLFVSNEVPAKAEVLLNETNPIIMLHSSVTKKLSRTQLLFLLSHELGHVLLSDAQWAALRQLDEPSYLLVKKELEDRCDLLGLYVVSQLYPLAPIPWTLETFPILTALKDIPTWPWGEEEPWNDPHRSDSHRQAWLTEEQGKPSLAAVMAPWDFPINPLGERRTFEAAHSSEQPFLTNDFLRDGLLNLLALSLVKFQKDKVPEKLAELKRGKAPVIISFIIGALLFGLILLAMSKFGSGMSAPKQVRWTHAAAASGMILAAMPVLSHPFEIQQINLSALLNEVSRNPRVRVDIPAQHLHADLPPSVSMDDVRSVLREFVDNALKAQKDGFVRIRHSIQDGNVQLSIEDKGSTTDRELPSTYALRRLKESGIEASRKVIEEKDSTVTVAAILVLPLADSFKSLQRFEFPSERFVGSSLKKIVDDRIGIPDHVLTAWRQLGSEADLRTIMVRGKTVRAKFIADPLALAGLGIEASFTQDVNGDLTIVTYDEIPPNVSDLTGYADLEIPIFHENVESLADDQLKATSLYRFLNLFRFLPGLRRWIDNRTRRQAHILASAQQIVEFGADHPWYLEQINAMSKTDREKLIHEYESGSRLYHYRLIDRFLGDDVLKQVIRQEGYFVENLRQEQTNSVALTLNPTPVQMTRRKIMEALSALIEGNKSGSRQYRNQLMAQFLRDKVFRKVKEGYFIDDIDLKQVLEQKGNAPKWSRPAQIDMRRIADALKVKWKAPNEKMPASSKKDFKVNIPALLPGPPSKALLKLLAANDAVMARQLAGRPAPEKSKTLPPFKTLPQFPGYVTVKLLGNGSFGSVYLARSGNHLVAIKVPKQDWLQAYLVREAEILDGLNNFPSPYLLSFDGLHPHPDGYSYLVMEYSSLGTFTEFLLTKNSRDQMENLKAFQEMASAVEAAHSADVIHADLNPENMLVGIKDGKAQAKIIDFGLSTRASDAGKPRDEGLIGAPGFIPPEGPIAGKMPGPSYDIYSLGVFLYMLMSRQGLEVILTNIRSKHTLAAAVNRDDTVSADVKFLIMNSIAIDPDKRYQSVSDLKLDLAAAVAFESYQSHYIKRLLPAEFLSVSEAIKLLPSPDIHKILDIPPLKLIDPALIFSPSTSSGSGTPASALYWFLRMGRKLGWWPNMKESTIQRWGMAGQAIEMAAFGWIPYLITGDTTGMSVTMGFAALHYPLMLLAGHRPREGLIRTLAPLVLLGYSLPALLGLPVLPVLIVISVLHAILDAFAIFKKGFQTSLENKNNPAENQPWNNYDRIAGEILFDVLTKIKSDYKKQGRLMEKLAPQGTEPQFRGAIIQNDYYLTLLNTVRILLDARLREQIRDAKELDALSNHIEAGQGSEGGILYKVTRPLNFGVMNKETTVGSVLDAQLKILQSHPALRDLASVSTLDPDNDDADFGAASNNSVGFSTLAHLKFHLQGNFENVIESIAEELNLKRDYESVVGATSQRGDSVKAWFNIREAVAAAGGRIVTKRGELRIEPDGVLVIINSDFKVGHAGRDQFAVYARDEAEAQHEMHELRFWAHYAMDNHIATQTDIDNGLLGTKFLGWLNIRGNKARRDHQARIRHLVPIVHEEAERVETTWRRKLGVPPLDKPVFDKVSVKRRQSAAYGEFNFMIRAGAATRRALAPEERAVAVVPLNNDLSEASSASAEVLTPDPVMLEAMKSLEAAIMMGELDSIHGALRLIWIIGGEEAYAKAYAHTTEVLTPDPVAEEAEKGLDAALKKGELESIQAALRQIWIVGGKEAYANAYAYAVDQNWRHQMGFYSKELAVRRPKAKDIFFDAINRFYMAMEKDVRNTPLEERKKRVRAIAALRDLWAVFPNRDHEANLHAAEIRFHLSEYLSKEQIAQLANPGFLKGMLALWRAYFPLTAPYGYSNHFQSKIHPANQALSHASIAIIAAANILALAGLRGLVKSPDIPSVIGSDGFGFPFANIYLQIARDPLWFLVFGGLLSAAIIYVCYFVREERRKLVAKALEEAPLIGFKYAYSHPNLKWLFPKMNQTKLREWEESMRRIAETAEYAIKGVLIEGISEEREQKIRQAAQVMVLRKHYDLTTDRAKILQERKLIQEAINKILSDTAPAPVEKQPEPMIQPLTKLPVVAPAQASGFPISQFMWEYWHSILDYYPTQKEIGYILSELSVPGRFNPGFTTDDKLKILITFAGEAVKKNPSLPKFLPAHVKSFFEQLATDAEKIPPDRSPTRTPRQNLGPTPVTLGRKVIVPITSRRTQEPPKAAPLSPTLQEVNKLPDQKPEETQADRVPEPIETYWQRLLGYAPIAIEIEGIYSIMKNSGLGTTKAELEAELRNLLEYAKDHPDDTKFVLFEYLEGYLADKRGDDTPPSNPLMHQDSYQPAVVFYGLGQVEYDEWRNTQNPEARRSLLVRAIAGLYRQRGLYLEIGSGAAIKEQLETMAERDDAEADSARLFLDDIRNQFAPKHEIPHFRELSEAIRFAQDHEISNADIARVKQRHPDLTDDQIRAEIVRLRIADATKIYQASEKGRRLGPIFGIGFGLVILLAFLTGPGIDFSTLSAYWNIGIRIIGLAIVSPLAYFFGRKYFAPFISDAFNHRKHMHLNQEQEKSGFRAWLASSFGSNDSLLTKINQLITEADDQKTNGFLQEAENNLINAIKLMTPMRGNPIIRDQYDLIKQRLENIREMQKPIADPYNANAYRPYLEKDPGSSLVLSKYGQFGELTIAHVRETSQKAKISHHYLMVLIKKPSEEKSDDRLRVAARMLFNVKDGVFSDISDMVTFIKDQNVIQKMVKELLRSGAAHQFRFPIEALTPPDKHMVESLKKESDQMDSDLKVYEDKGDWVVEWRDGQQFHGAAATTRELPLRERRESYRQEAKSILGIPGTPWPKSRVTKLVSLLAKEGNAEDVMGFWEKNEPELYARAMDVLIAAYGFAPQSHTSDAIVYPFRGQIDAFGKLFFRSKETVADRLKSIHQRIAAAIVTYPAIAIQPTADDIVAPNILKGAGDLQKALIKLGYSESVIRPSATVPVYFKTLQRLAALETNIDLNFSKALEALDVNTFGDPDGSDPQIRLAAALLAGLIRGLDQKADMGSPEARLLAETFKHYFNNAMTAVSGLSDMTLHPEDRLSAIIGAEKELNNMRRWMALLRDLPKVEYDEIGNVALRRLAPEPPPISQPGHFGTVGGMVLLNILFFFRHSLPRIEAVASVLYPLIPILLPIAVFGIIAAVLWTFRADIGASMRARTGKRTHLLQLISGAAQMEVNVPLGSSDYTPAPTFGQLPTFMDSAKELIGGQA